jgi:pimeloyl-ACP methyl ester carboxylesterase
MSAIGRLTRSFIIFLIVAAVIYIGFLCALFFYQGAILYPGTQTRVGAAPDKSLGEESSSISTAFGSMEIIFLPATAVTASKQPVVIFAHGNGEVVDDWLTALNGFRTRGIGVLLVEYPGYGRSAGKPSESAIRTAMDAAYDRISADPRVDRSRIFGFGESLGGGAICLLARDRNLRALILQSTFPSLDIFAARYWAPAFLLRDHFDSYSSLAKFAGPVLVIHGSHDQLIPWLEGKRLSMASSRSTFKLYDCGHGCWEPERLPFWQDAVPFLIESGILDRTDAAASKF